MLTNQPNQNTLTATCIVQHKLLNPKTNRTTWENQESVIVTGSSIEQLTERAYALVRRPEELENVLAIKLTGHVLLLNGEQDPRFDHKNSVAIQLHILRERTLTKIKPTHDKNDNRSEQTKQLEVSRCGNA